MNAHVSNIARTCYYELRRLASIRRFLTSTATATLVSAFVLSRIDYCNSLLFGSTNDVTSHLQRIQNYAARVIFRLPMSSSITIHLKSLHWLPVKVRSTYKIACLCYHCHSSTAPSYVTDKNKTLIKMVFTKVNVRKSVGPDGICSKLLKVCAPQLCQVFSALFTWSLKDGIVPGLWKTSMICPIPKNNSPSDLSDYRPIAITSVVMKCFEKIVLHHLLDLTKGMQDPFQFAYKPNRSIEDAILTLLHNTFLHTNNPKSYVRILFADFSSAFNTIKPYHLAKKLVRLNISPKLVIWIINFLSHRKQFVRFKGVLSGERSISTGVPQGCVLSPVLFTLYTNDCTGTENTIFIKYSDETAIVDLSNSIPHYIEEVDRFTTWCKANFLDLNVAKTKELLIDFRKQPPAVSPITIDGEIVERVMKYKYLGIILDNKLKFDSNVLNIYKKCHYRIYCLQRLRNIGINSKILALYYQSCVETLVTSCLICWYGSVNLRSKKLLNNIVKVC